MRCSSTQPRVYTRGWVHGDINPPPCHTACARGAPPPQSSWHPPIPLAMESGRPSARGLNGTASAVAGFACRLSGLHQARQSSSVRWGTQTFPSQSKVCPHMCGLYNPYPSLGMGFRPPSICPNPCMGIHVETFSGQCTQGRVPTSLWDPGRSLGHSYSCLQPHGREGGLSATDQNLPTCPASSLRAEEQVIVAQVPPMQTWVSFANTHQHWKGGRPARAE